MSAAQPPDTRPCAHPDCDYPDDATTSQHTESDEQCAARNDGRCSHFSSHHPFSPAAPARSCTFTPKGGTACGDEPAADHFLCAKHAEIVERRADEYRASIVDPRDELIASIKTAVDGSCGHPCAQRVYDLITQYEKGHQQ